MVTNDAFFHPVGLWRALLQRILKRPCRSPLQRAIPLGSILQGVPHQKQVEPTIGSHHHVVLTAPDFKVYITRPR